VKARLKYPGYGRRPLNAGHFRKESDMKQEIKYSVLIAALLGLALAGCQKKEEPVPEMPGSEAPAPQVTEPTPMSEPAPAMEPAPTDAPMEPVPGESGEAAPMQPAPTPPAQ
jgi:hypothetical protein